MQKYLLALGIFLISAFGFGIPVHAAAPFTDTFDTYHLGSLYHQGLWQDATYPWRVTSQGCYDDTGLCITSTGVDLSHPSNSNLKTGTPLSFGEWRVRFKVKAPFLSNTSFLFISFGSATTPDEMNFNIVDDPATYPAHTSDLYDDSGTFSTGGLAIGTWHTLVFAWNMSDLSKCTFSATIDGGASIPITPAGSASDCYAATFPNHSISTLHLWTYHLSAGQAEIDDIGDGPILDGCNGTCPTPPAQVSDTFDSFNDHGWAGVQLTQAQLQALSTSQYGTPSLEPATSGNCHSGGCVTIRGGATSFSAAMYLESGVGTGAGAFTLWGRARPAQGSHIAQGNIGLCFARWSECFGPSVYVLTNVLTQDDAWHQYYVAWRQGTSAVETCVLQDDTDPTHCTWVPTTVPLGTLFDGVQLSGSVVNGISGVGDQVWFDELKDASDMLPPTTTVSLTGTPGLHGWFISSVTATLAATDVGSGVADTYYSLDGAATTTVVGQAGATIPITTEGVHTLLYYSVDVAGNVEPLRSTTVRIDETAPEAIIAASTTIQDLEVTGVDPLSTTMVVKTPTTVTITDQAGNTTALNFSKTYSGKVLTYAHLTSIQYGAETPVSLPSSFLFVWNVLKCPPPLLSQTVVVDPVYGIEALYSQRNNQTTIALLQKGQKIQITTVPQLAIIKLTTNKGVMGYSW